MGNITQIRIGGLYYDILDKSTENKVEQTKLDVSNLLQLVNTIEENSLKTVVLTDEEYQKIGKKDNRTLYLIKKS